MLYKFENENQVGICRVKNIQTCWYDMKRDGDCFDENFYNINTNIENILSCVETIEDVNNYDRSRVFVNMDNGDTYELIMKKVNKQKCDNFYGK